MKILVLNEDNIITYKLPERIEGNLWITSFDENDMEKNLVNIEANSDGTWKILSNSDYYLVEDSKKIDFSILKEYNFYLVRDSYSNKFYILYCAPSYENNFKYYSVASNLVTGITIGKSSNCTINYNSSNISDISATFKLDNDKVYIESKDRVYVNGELITKRELLYGDTVFIMGLEIVMIRVKGLQVFAINNPNNLVSTFLKEEIINSDINDEKFDEAIEEKEINLYSEKDYFYRKPRFIYSVKEFDLEIDSPPAKQEKDEMPAILTLGPMLTMSLTSVVTISQTINNVQNGNQTWEEARPSLIISGAMVVSLLLWPLLTNIFQKYLNKKKEKDRQEKYNKYLDSQRELISLEEKNQEDILRRSYLSLKECEEIIISKNDRLWERRVEDEDFLSVSLGYGNLPMNINVKYPVEKFSMIEDNLKKKVEELSKCENILKDVPIPFSLSENYITAIIGEKKYSYTLAKNILFQLLTFHSYDNLKIIIFSSKNKIFKFDEFRNLPHFFTDDRTIRFFADKNDEYKEIAYHLEKVLNSRKEYIENGSFDDKSFNQKYLIVTDSFDSIRNIDFIKNIVESKNNLGFSILILNDKISNLPDQCQSFIEVNQGESKIFKNIANNNEQKFKIEYSDIDFIKCFRILSNLPIKFNNSSEGIIPKKVGFLEMYEVGKVEQLNCKNRWQENVPLLNMGAIVGIGKNGEKIVLDLHEKYHGPHGLIAGMTGSGKSEFIITYILSMAINYHPYEVQFILIDYKGGGLAGAFENNALGYKLPHLVGVITNLDKTEINRSLASIESELKRRQSLFNKAREISGESTIDIYKYQKLYRNGVVQEPVAHLIIIADEFAELKNQQPEFMEQLISTARIGRSLGVHLILATQKPSGIVDAQIWSNTRFRVCLRVQETSDSSEVIKCPDAAYLTQTGRFYLQVGYNEIFVLGQSAWAGGKYIPSENIKKTIDTSVNFINNIGYVTKNIETKKADTTVISNNGEELINIVKYLCGSAMEEQIKCNPLWLDKIPEFILVTDLIQKYNYTKEQYILNPVIGEYDIPGNQKQNILTIPFSKEGNVLVYGIAGSGKENFITTMIYSSMLIYTPMEVNYYILDFGAEILKYFQKSNLVGDVLSASDSEKISNLFKMISDTISERKKLFAEYNGDYLFYCKNSGKMVPNIVIIINGYEAFIETYPDYYDLLIILTRDCVKYGIFFMFTTNVVDGIRFKLRQNFGQNFVLQQTNEEDYSQILGNTHKTFPSKYFGRGLIKKEDIYEFQTAYISQKENISTTVSNINDILIKKYGVISRKVPILPDIVVYDELNIENHNDTIIGINKFDLKNSTYNFKLDNINIITGLDFSLFETFVNPLLYQFSKNNTLLNIIINCEDMTIEDEVKSASTYFDSNFDNVFNTILTFLNNSIDLYNKNNQDKSIFINRKKVICTIIGPNSFKDKLSEENRMNFGKIFNLGEDLDIIDYIFVQTEDKLKSFEYEDWYKNNHSKSNFIWIGSGISSQYTFNVTTRIPELNEEIPYNFCFVVKKGKPEYVKFVEKIHI